MGRARLCGPGRDRGAREPVNEGAGRLANLRFVEDFPARIADFLESVATRIREMTVDRVARVIKFVTLGCLGAALVMIAGVFFLVGLFRIVEELIFKACDCSQAMEISYAVVGGLFLLIGALVWARRTRTDSDEDPE